MGNFYLVKKKKKQPLNGFRKSDGVFSKSEQKQLDIEAEKHERVQIISFCENCNSTQIYDHALNDNDVTFYEPL